MRINTNISALNTWRHYSGATRLVERHFTRLSSGQRVNSAADDPAGLAISERMRSGIRGMRMAMRNIQDGISLIQTAEGTLHEVSSLLQRGRELALYAANGVLTPDDRASLQLEMENIIAEVDRISAAGEFNRKRLLEGGVEQPDPQQLGQLVESLRRSWLRQSEALVRDYYGLQADHVPLKIIADLDGPNPAFVRGQYDASGKMTNLELHINLDYFRNVSLPNGGAYPQYADRVVAHEMVHAVMARTMDFQALPDWFKEGAAEFIHGADERLKADLSALPGPLANQVATLVNDIDSWEGTSADYSVGYAAVKYLHKRIIDAGGSGIKALMTELSLNGLSLDDAIKTATANAYTDTAAFVADFKSAAGGQAFILGLDLNDSDPGAVVPNQTAESVVPDFSHDTWDPLERFQEVWPVMNARSEGLKLQVGPYADQVIDLPLLVVNSYALGLTGTDLVGKADEAMDRFAAAIKTVTGLRSQLGAIQNRLEHTYNANAVMAENLVASESKIRDADMASEIAGLTRTQLLTQTSVAMLAQASNLRRDSLRNLLGA